MARHLHTNLVCVLLLAMLSNDCHAGEENIIADKFVVQYAGMLGMISLGVENTAGPHSDYQLLAGYTPASAAGVDIYSAGVRANYVFNPLMERKGIAARIYTGIGFYYYFGERYQSYDYPEGYYTPPASEWHLMPYLGIRATGLVRSQKELTLYAEAGIIDAYLIHYYNNYQTLDLGDVVSLGLGITIPLR